MAFIGAAFLLAIGRTLARIHVEYDDPRQSLRVYLVDPPGGQIRQSGKVLRPGQPLRLEAAHLAGRGSRSLDRSVADHPPDRRIMVHPLSIVHVLVASKPSKHRLPQQADQRMAPVPASARVGQDVTGHGRQSKRVIQLAIRQ
jgi:hypothetical protein